MLECTIYGPGAGRCPLVDGRTQWMMVHSSIMAQAIDIDIVDIGEHQVSVERQRSHQADVRE